MDPVLVSNETNTAGISATFVSMKMTMFFRSCTAIRPWTKTNYRVCPYLPDSLYAVIIGNESACLVDFRTEEFEDVAMLAIVVKVARFSPCNQPRPSPAFSFSSAKKSRITGSNPNGLAKAIKHFLYHSIVCMIYGRWNIACKAVATELLNIIFVCQLKLVFQVLDQKVWSFTRWVW
ncbi:hypothetical protein An11g08590 [Aspergillus niger]|uniref:Uncharacterized protein n=2 Tax=Aspergillus niger TaxID=5061 RepID=A2QXE0_ASPNC|nr:hypothetical protein An11g08590 [Aspergillus niger]CAK46048.1 hypothetical protein An11g08590 [Aspergillus niger]